MKLLPPERYDGETDFERFAKLLTAYMGCQDTDYCDMLEVASKRDAPITTADINGMATTSVQRGREPGELKLLNARLYYVLISLTDKGAFTIVDNVEDSNGMESWRKLSDRFARTKRQMAVMSLVAQHGNETP